MAGLLIACGGATRPLRAQSLPSCALVPVAAAGRVAAAALIVEAEVRSAQGEWDAAHRRIYTRQRLRVFRVLKGTLADTSVALLVEGGRVGLSQQVLTNTLGPLPVGQQGLFFLQPAPWAGVAPGWAAYASSQGVITYDLARQTATEPTRAAVRIGAAVGQASALSGQAVRVLRPNPALAAGPAAGASGTQQRTQAASITSFSPAQASAGTGAVLTLRGSGFGGSRGSGGVEFRNADDGGASTTRALDVDYVSWSDTQVQVRIPSLATGGHPAGTGLVRLTTSDGSTAETATALTIVYALSNVADAAYTLVDRPGHVVPVGAAGLTFRLSASLEGNAAATAAWLRGLNRWRCTTGVNWARGTTAPAATVGQDSLNTITFDAGTLPALVLGRTTSYYQGCYDPQGNVFFYTSEIDQQFSASLPFQYGPALATPGQYDFESVATHELGHAQQLAHLIRPGAVMHYGIAAAANLRTLDPASDVAGGRAVLRTRSFRSRGCGGAPMLPAPLASLGAMAGSTTFAFATRDECLVSGFVLERAAAVDTTAASASWQVLTSVSATGASSQYQLADAQPPAGLHYYRLGVRRPDGSTDYAAPLLAGTTTTETAQLFPNPLTGDQLQLAYPATASGDLDLQLYDALGRYYLSQRVAVQTGFNLVTLSATGLRPGFYLLRLSTNGQVERTLRLVRL